MPSDKINISRGAQFRGGKTAYLFLVTVALICLTGAMLFEGEYLIAAISITVAILSLFFVLDVHGVEIDLRKKGVRHYRLRPWGRDGEWQSLSEFRAIEIDHEKYMVNVRSAYQLGDIGGRIIRERHWRFTVFLVGIKANSHILLMETQDLNKALKFANQSASRLRMPMIDKVRRNFKSQYR